MNKDLYINYIGKDTKTVSKIVITTCIQLSEQINQQFEINPSFFTSLVRYVTTNTDIPTEIVPARIISNIVKIYKAGGVEDPILSSTGLYNIISNKKIILNSSTNDYAYYWPIKFISLNDNTFTSSKVSVSQESKLPIINNNFEITFLFLKFKQFAVTYLNKLNTTILNSDSKLRILYYLFYQVFYRIVSQQKIYKFINYEKITHENKNSETAVYRYNIESEYNFYNEQYENTFNKNFGNLSALPNYYLLESYLYTQESDQVKNAVTLNNRINVKEQSVLDTDYYNDYAKELPLIEQEEIDTTLSYTKNYLLNSNFSNYFQTSLSTENFPYCNKIKFNNYIEDQYSQFIVKNELNSLFAYNIASNFFNGYFSSFEIYKNDKKIINESLFYTDICKFVSEFVDTNRIIGFKINSGQKIDNNFYSLSNISEALSQPNSILTYMNLLNTTINFFCSNNIFDYKSVISNTKQPLTSLGFLIEKISNVDNYKQNIVLSRENSFQEYEVIDTQVIYDEEINYNVYSFDLVPFTNYVHQTQKYGIPPSTNNEINDSANQHKIFVSTTLEQVLNVVKNQIFSNAVTVVDDPPLTPDINIVPFYGTNNAMKFLFNTQLGSYKEVPINILDDDKEKFDKIISKQANKYTSLDSKIMFQTDDFIKQIQTFRTTTKPVSYSDFSNFLYRVDDLENVTAISYIDEIVPNTKYYYIFRSIDIHNNISNPSSVFEVQILDNDGAIYPIVKTITLEENKNYDLAKPFKKYLHIKPSLFQTQISLNEDGKTVKYGEKGNLWGQNFKIRVTSKKTGKSFDINLTFSKIDNKID